MIREYQTQIVVGGEKVDAYGDTCLLADGSWRRGVPKLVPD
jgi:surface antigen